MFKDFGCLLLLLNGLSSLTQIENIFSRVGCVVIRNFALPDWPRKSGWVPTGKESTRLFGLCLIYNWVAEIVNADWLAHAQRLSYVNAKFGEILPKRVWLIYNLKKISFFFALMSRDKEWKRHDSSTGKWTRRNGGIFIQLTKFIEFWLV